MPDELPIEPSTLAPGAPSRGDWLARLLIWPLLVLLMVLTIVFYVAFSPLQVAGDSMEPSLHHADRALRTKSYQTPERGDIVVLTLAPGLPGEEDIVKRVIGIPGDTVEIVDDIAYVNGVGEATGNLLLAPGYGVTQEPVVVPPRSVYVLGDNRPISLDSRSVGVVPLAALRGRVVFRFLPPSSFGLAR